MKFYLYLFINFLCLEYFVQSASQNYDVIYFNQKVDHFNYIHDETFKQKIVISKKYLTEKDPPLFVYAGNEGKIFTFVNNTQLMWELEDKFKAVIIFIEHRYYGSSFPNQKSKKDYSYLSIEQALADFAMVIDDFKNSKKYDFKNSPVVVFGGSYGGMLASWLRIKYPHLVQGAIAGSAPILQFLDYYNCLEFNKVVTKDYEGYSPVCASVIRKTWPALRRLSSSNNGTDFISKEFKLCKAINEKDIGGLINYFGGILINVAMTDYPAPSSFLKPMPGYPMKEICKFLTTDQLDDINLVKSFKNAIYSIYLNYTGTAPTCINLNSDSTDLGAEGWYYQTCTEAVMPICSDGKDDFFEPDPFNLTEVEIDCKNFFNVSIDPYKVRMEYSLHDLRAATNVVFSNGDRDPWSSGGVLITNYEQFGLKKLKGNELTKTIFEYFGVYTEKSLENIVFTNGPIIINIPHACHHEDLRGSTEFDSKELITARKQEIKIIEKWIQDYRNTFN